MCILRIGMHISIVIGFIIQESTFLSLLCNLLLHSDSYKSLFYLSVIYSYREVIKFCIRNVLNTKIKPFEPDISNKMNKSIKFSTLRGYDFFYFFFSNSHIHSLITLCLINIINNQNFNNQIAIPSNSFAIFSAIAF